MRAYTEQELERARAPLRTGDDRDGALCTLGHLLTEQREAYSADREATIKAITAAVQDFDTRTALGGAIASSFAGTSGIQPVAHAPRPPAPQATTSTSTQHLLRDDMAARATASMDRELRRQGLTPVASAPARIDVLAASRSAGTPGSNAAATASMERELRRAGLVRG